MNKYSINNLSVLLNKCFRVLFSIFLIYSFLYLDLLLNNFNIHTSSSIYSNKDLSELEEKISSFEQFAPVVYEENEEIQNLEVFKINEKTLISTYNKNYNSIQIVTNSLFTIKKSDSRVLLFKSIKLINGENKGSYTFIYNLKKFNNNMVLVDISIMFEKVDELKKYPKKLNNLDKICEYLLSKI
jgi:hypothetical protein